jgi:hypothetical protein
VTPETIVLTADACGLPGLLSPAARPAARERLRSLLWAGIALDDDAATALARMVRGWLGALDHLDRTDARD